MKQLVSELRSQGSECHLRSLALVSMKINFALDDLAALVNESQALQDLDLSHNACLPCHFEQLLKALAHNKTIHNVNLSWNTLISR